MKKHTVASKVEKRWTVLLVDGRGRIRRIPHFRRKLWTIAGISAGALILAAILGILYGGTLRKQVALSGEVDVLQAQLLAMREQNELLKARAVRLESRAGIATNGQKPAQAPPAKPPKGEDVDRPAAVAATAPSAEQVQEPADIAPEATEPAETRAPAADQAPQVDAEGLKITYQPDTEMLEARFVIKNTGDVPAGGRTIVVLHTAKGPSQVHLALPAVPLRGNRPAASGGRRFSISRFMTLTLERRFAEPGTRFVGAVLYAYTLDGRLLLEKPFDVTLDIPPAEVPRNTLPIAAPLGLDLPEPEHDATTGVQP